MKKIIFIGITVALFGTLGFFFGRNRNHRSVIHPKMGPIVESIYGLGTVQSDNVYNIKLGVTAMVKKIFVKEGELVKKGQKLIQFDDDSVRVKYAPFDASVTQINYYAGETVFPQSAIITLMDLNHRYVVVTLDQEGALRVRPQQRALLSFGNGSEGQFAGTVRALFPRQGQLVAHILAPNLPANILPGMTADVSIVVSEKPQGVLIPIRALQKNAIRLLKNDQVELTTVQLGVTDAEWVEILGPPLSDHDSIELPGD